jgi:hypothetical protein
MRLQKLQGNASAAHIDQAEKSAIVRGLHLARCHAKDAAKERAIQIMRGAVELDDTNGEHENDWSDGMTYTNNATVSGVTLLK